MTVVFKRAVRDDVKLIIMLVGETGGGKTFTGMITSEGLSGGKPFAVIDTESGRAKHYAGMFNFDHADIGAPFRPQTYLEAILAAEEAHYPVIMIDSFSHEWAGEGGILDWQEEELTRMAGDNYGKREACKMASWIKPKMAHKKMVQHLLQLRSHLIICLRAEEKIDMIKGDDGKMKIVPKVTRTGAGGWVPICEKNLPFEATISMLFTSDAPGVPRPIKIQAQHRAFIPLDKPIDKEVGRRLAEWADGTDQRPSYDVESAIKSYESVNTLPEFESLQKSRSEAWKSIPPSEGKKRLQAAAEAALKRLESQQAPADDKM